MCKADNLNADSAWQKKRDFRTDMCKRIPGYRQPVYTPYKPVDLTWLARLVERRMAQVAA